MWFVNGDLISKIYVGIGVFEGKVKVGKLKDGVWFVIWII